MKSIITLATLLLCGIGSFSQQQFTRAQDYYDLENKIALKVNAAIDSFRWDTLPGKIP